MPHSRDSLLPSTSVGRAGSAQLQRVASHESLSAHPLLSPNSPSLSSASAQTSGPDISTGTAPRYVPYTPRHRPPTSSATTGTTTHSSIPVAAHHQQQGGATSKLQLQNLKAAAQGIGLGNGTVGWAILEKLVDGETGPEWDDIWKIIAIAKPTLLLPLEPSSGEVITPEFVKDHVAFCIGSSSSPLVTLSGLRGLINNGTLNFQSTLPVTSNVFSSLLKSDTQPAVLMSLSPLPTPLIPNGVNSLPSFALPGYTSLPLPPRFHNSKPPLPPRPGASSSTPPKSPNAPRISNPFASLFGRPVVSSTAITPTTSSSPSQESPQVDDAQDPTNVGVEVAAFSVGKKIVKKSVGKELSGLIKEEIKGGLVDCPAWVVDRVLEFTGPLHPIPKYSKRMDIRRTSSGSYSSIPHRASSIIAPSTNPSSDPSALADAFQTFYSSIEEDLRAGLTGSPLFNRRKEKRIMSSQDGLGALETDSSEESKANEPKGKQDGEVKIKAILEHVEGVMCSVFYDRTFRPLSGDDTSHDDALANRIAALNMLDLGLEHLGVELPNETVKKDVYDVIKSCGAVLQRLEDPEHRSPAQKSASFVHAHRQLVDGLSRLPQLRLKPEREFEEQDQKTPRASSFSKQAAQDAITEASVSPTPGAATTASKETIDPKQALESGDNTLQEVLVTSPQGIDPPSVPSDSNIVEAIAKALPYTEDAHSDALRSDLPETNAPPRTTTPPLPPSFTPVTSTPSTPPTVSGDLLFPLLIFSVVKANPAHLVSHLLYTQRFRSRSVGGQESYCLINLMAVVEFLEHVDMGALGLGDSERVMSTADLTPIPLAHGPIDSTASSPSPFSTRIGKRVNQQVEELAGLAGSANKVITGVVDSSFGVLRGFLTSNPDLSTPHGEVQDTAPWNSVRPGFGLLRRGSGFSIASVAASLPGRPKTPAGGAGEEGQQLIEVSSRPSSIKEIDLEEEDEGDTSTSSLASGDESVEDDGVPDRGDARSVRSFSSMMSRESRDRDRTDGKERLSLTDRLANMSARSKITSSPAEQHGVKPSPPSSRTTSRPSSWIPPPAIQSDMPVASPELPKIRIPPPCRRFLECAEQDIRVGEVGELLREYRRMVQALRTVGAFEDL